MTHVQMNETYNVSYIFFFFLKFRKCPCYDLTFQFFPSSLLWSIFIDANSHELHHKWFDKDRKECNGRRACHCQVEISRSAFSFHLHINLNNSHRAMVRQVIKV